jgi:nucleotide-binding universal stress UspA family protein
MTSAGPVVVATDLTEASRPALVRGRAYAVALHAPLIVCHVVVDVFRAHPLIPNPAQNELVLETSVMARAADLVTDQVRNVLGPSSDDVRIVVESGAPDEEIVRVAETNHASLIALGGKPREGVRLVLGHVAERVVRYAHTSVLVAREGNATGRMLVATDFSEGSLPALALAAEIARSTGARIRLVHVVKPPSSVLSSALMPLGNTWTPPSKAAMDELEALGVRTLEGLAKEHGFESFEQLHGDPADVIIERAEALEVEAVVMGSRGRRGLARLVLGSVAEKVIRNSHCSVIVARPALGGSAAVTDQSLVAGDANVPAAGTPRLNRSH